MNSEQPPNEQELDNPQLDLQEAQSALAAWQKVAADPQLSREAAHHAREMVRSLSAVVRMRVLAAATGETAGAMAP